MYKPSEVKQAVKDAVRGYLLKSADGNYIYKEVNRLPIYLEGSPGLGKTEIAKQVAEELQIGFVSSSLTHHTRQSVLGLPVIQQLDEDVQFTQYTMSEIIGMVWQQKEKGYDEGILLLDEFPCVSESILPVMLAFLQTKNIGNHHLPEGWVILLCGNPPECNKSARRFDAAINDRLRKLHIEFCGEDFLLYAEQHGFHKTILSYLKIHQEHIYVCENKTDGDLVTCRGWENLSHALKVYEQLNQKIDENFIYQFIKSEKIAYEFNKYYKLTSSGCTEEDIDNILKGIRLQEYAARWNENDFVEQWYIVDVLANSIKNMVDKQANQVYLANQANEAVTNVFLLLAYLKNKEQLTAHFYHFITDLPPLVQVLAEKRNVEYIKVCRQMYPTTIK
jgi:hypothetical protein